MRQLTTFPSLKTLDNARKKSRSLMVFGGILKYHMSPDVYSYLARLDRALIDLKERLRSKRATSPRLCYDSAPASLCLTLYEP